MYIYYIPILNSLSQYFTIQIILGIIGTLILGIMGSLCAECILKIVDRKIEKRYFEIYKKMEKCTHQDFNIAEYNEAYYLRKENFLILKALDNSKNILITGKPKSGKTRAAYESLKTLNGFKVIKFYSNKPVELEEIPDRIFKSHILFKQKLIIFIDDLNKYSEKLDFIHLIKKLESNTKDFIVVATCKSGVEYESISDY
jgi:DNA replication protein DnaC